MLLPVAFFVLLLQNCFSLLRHAKDTGGTVAPITWVALVFGVFAISLYRYSWPLNSACLEWLDNTENNHYIASCGKTPHELFKDEATLLRKIPLTIYDSDKIEYFVFSHQRPIFLRMSLGMASLWTMMLITRIWT